MTEGKIFEKVNQVAVLANEIRFKILLALFSSDITINNQRLGTRSHTFSDLQKIVDVKKPDLSYHLEVLTSSNLVDKNKGQEGVYHISKEGCEVLNLFGVTEKLVQKTGKDIL